MNLTTGCYACLRRFLELENMEYFSDEACAKRPVAKHYAYMLCRILKKGHHAAVSEHRGPSGGPIQTAGSQLASMRPRASLSGQRP